MPLDDLLDDGKADARTWIFPSAMQPLEHLEYLAGVVHVQADEKLSALFENAGVLAQTGPSYAEAPLPFTARTR